MSPNAYQVLREGSHVRLTRRPSTPGGAPALTVTLTAEQPTRESVERLQHEYALREFIDREWAARPSALSAADGRLSLVLEDPGGEVLSPARPWALIPFLRVAIGIAKALGALHGRGLIHKDIKPANILVDASSGNAWLTGFGLASRLPRERGTIAPPEVIAGTLAYMAPSRRGA
ncbi:Signal transduction histidine kinase CheA [Labilithrix luteola]|uniref:Signal transduction histidine kinase CheA n=1 Tax=Labilithrix luteola TaxID=1391654 RepID=A0A0K1PYZ7_9BACT|nr:protein kinase [Labilithrix luteola]AKU98707.1 Signal transduction histidine kinase CheA [Labilithrix luteola]